MPLKEFNIIWQNGELAISAEYLREEYLFGLPLTDSDGNPISNKILEQKIVRATYKLAQILDIKIIKEIIEERQDYVATEWSTGNGHIKANYNVNKIINVEGVLNEENVLSFPEPNTVWRQKGRSIAFIPARSATSNIITGLSGSIFPVLVTRGEWIPDFWKIEYESGFDKIPLDIVDVIGKSASIDILNVLGDILLGAGIANQSISIDGLSQSVGTTQSATNSAFGARIGQYEREIKNDLPNLIDRYRGIRMVVM